MTLAPIRGAPPGAPNPDFPIGKPTLTSAQPVEARTANDQQQAALPRQRGAPIEFGANGYTLTFALIPEIPAIRRASLTMRIVADAVGSSASDMLGFLQMSAANARAFLSDLRSGGFPLAATGDEGGTVQIEFELTEAGSALLIYDTDQRHILHRLVIDREFDLQSKADQLLADLGA